MRIDGLRDYCQHVLNSDEVVSVRVRVGANGRSTKTVHGQTPVQLEDYIDDASAVESVIKAQLRKAQMGDKNPAFRLEGVNAAGKAVSGYGFSGRRDNKTSKPKATAAVSREQAQMDSKDAAISQLTEALVNVVDSLRLVSENQAQTIADMGRQRLEQAGAMGNLKAELARSQMEAQLAALAGQAGGMGAEEEAGIALLSQFMEAVALKNGGGKLTKELVLKAVKADPEKALELLADPEVMQQAQAALAAAAAKAKPA